MTSSVPSSPAPKLPLSLLALPTFANASTFRLQALYSDFSRQKHSNPASFHANVEWWRKTLENFVASGLQRRYTQTKDQQNLYGERQLTVNTDLLVLHANRSLIDNLRVEGVGKPIGLGAVLPDLCSQTPLPPFMKLADFLSRPTSIYAQGNSIPYLIASYIVAKPLWWALEQIGITGEEGMLSSSSTSRNAATTAWHGDYVILSLIEKAAEDVISLQENTTTSPADYLYTFAEFRTKFAVCLSHSEKTEGGTMAELDAKVLLRYLERDKAVIVVQKETIKFMHEDTTAEINPVDVGILELKTAVKKLETQIEGIKSRIQQATEKASAALKEKHKDIAMNYIRSRKQLQELLTKRLASLGNLESTLLSVEAAAGDIEILSAFESSTVTLKTILSHPSLQRESIDRTMEAMAEANADAKEVDEAIKIAGDVAVGISADDFDVEDELNELVKAAERTEAEAQEREVEDKLAKLRPVPTPVPEEEKEKERVMV